MQEDTSPPPSPGTREEADVHRVRDLYNGLQLELSMRRQRDFLALTRAYLLRYSISNRLPLTSNSGMTGIDPSALIDDATLAFLFLFGPRLRPSLHPASLRAHLQEGAFLHYRLDIARDAGLDHASEIGWDRPPSFSGGRFQCLLRQAVREYFFQVSCMVYEAAEDRDIDGLFARVVRGKERDAGNGYFDSSR